MTKIYPGGRAADESLNVADLLIGTSIHARDLFSLALTSVEEEKANIGKKKYMRNHMTAILPRGDKVVVSECMYTSIF